MHSDKKSNTKNIKSLLGGIFLFSLQKRNIKAMKNEKK